MPSHSWRRNCDQAVTEMLCIIDYGSGNIAAISNICQRERIAYSIASEPSGLKGATHYLLPGVGAFDPTINILESSGLLAALRREVLEDRKPVLGICVGMHLLANGSDEGRAPGLCWIPGHVTRIDVETLSRKPHLPHMGWNSVQGNRDDPLLRDIDREKGFYFLHSYYYNAFHSGDVVATVEYGTALPCIVRHDNIVGAQFHPEKSHSNGVRFLKNFVGLI